MTNQQPINKNITIFLLFLAGFGLWFLPIPEGIPNKAWQLFIIFIITIVGIILNPLPMGAISILSIAVCVLTGTLSLKECLDGFGSDIVWLVVFAFFISLGFIKTGLGSRIAYFFISKLGKSTLGLSYGLTLSDFMLSPLIPSVTARGGGIIFPIAQSLCKSYGDEAHHHAGGGRTGGFIMQVCSQSNVITSSLFLTAMAANPLIVKLAHELGVKISWFDWAYAAIIPGFINLTLMPLLIFWIYPPSVKHSDHAPKIAKEKLAEMGPMTLKEKIMSLTFFLLIGLWIFGDKIGISATTTALIGVCILLVFRIISFDDCLSDKGAWHTFIWFATLVMLSGFLSKLGMMTWFGNKLKVVFIGFDPTLAVIVMGLIYFYSHYFFASITTHVTVLYPTFFTVFVASGMPDQVAALSLGFMSILSGGITHFSIASAPIFFGAGYVKTRTWWYVGFMVSALNLAVWTVFGGAWWKALGLW
jgi:DASS family divalent anion:Na+ symporter